MIESCARRPVRSLATIGGRLGRQVLSTEWGGGAGADLVVGFSERQRTELMADSKGESGFSLVEIMVVAAVMGIILAVAVPAYIAYKRSACDSAVQRDLANISASVERLRQESTARNCGFEVLGKAFDIGWLAGPFYGWSGTGRNCDVRIRRGAEPFSTEVWGCARNGSRPTGDPNERYIFRLSLTGGADLPAARGDCSGPEWRQYGGEGKPCYGSTMFTGQSCTPSEPTEKANCPAPPD